MIIAVGKLAVMKILLMCRSSRPQRLSKVGVIKIAKFTGKHQRRSLFMKLQDAGIKPNILL